MTIAMLMHNTVNSCPAPRRVAATGVRRGRNHGFQAPVETSTAKIRELTLGSKKTVTVGGQNALAFHSFEGTLPNGPKIAMEVFDTTPPTGPTSSRASSATSGPIRSRGRKKCEGEFGADIICLQLAGTDPNGANRSVADAVATVKAVVDAISAPLMVYGSGNVREGCRAAQGGRRGDAGQERRHRRRGRGELQVDRRGGDGFSAPKCRGDPIDVTWPSS